MTLTGRIILLLLWLLPTLSFAQVADTLNLKQDKELRDTIIITGDTIVQQTRELAAILKERSIEKWNAHLQSIRNIPAHFKITPRDTSRPDLAKPFKNLLRLKPALRLDGGYVAYHFNYRSAVDTPYVDKNLSQHNVTGQLNTTVAGLLPLQVNFWLRQSNSRVFRDISDVQVSFNGAAFYQQLQSTFRERMLALTPAISDSLLKKAYALKKLQLNHFSALLQTQLSEQRIAEAREILRIPKVTWQANRSDSANSRRADSLKKAAAFLLGVYDKTKSTYDSLRHEVDSLGKAVQAGQQKVAALKALIRGGWKDHASLKKLEKQLEAYGLGSAAIPAKYRWLMGIRRFSVGRSTAQYSDLTANNVSVNGINFEYNSWYYLALVAGALNYRFRDFAVSEARRKPQSLFMVRAGIGSLEGNHVIVSAWRGEKQLFAPGVRQQATVAVSGISAETKWRITRTSWISAEVAQSVAPDLRNNPPKDREGFDLRDRSNQAVALRFYSYIPVSNTRLEAFYKHTGANFQSFNAFQTAADMESWYIKAEQNLFKRKLRIAAALRKNEFANPFIVQNYKSNTVFKSIAATLRLRKWPVISVGYQPMSQFTYVDDRVMENRFQALNATLYYPFALSHVRTASTMMFNKFYNNSSDTGFVYYNATNFYWSQHFFFKLFTTHMAASHTQNSGYTLNVLEGGIQPNLSKVGTVGVGVKVNSFNNEVIKVGGYVNANIRVFKQDMLYVTYEHGYLPTHLHTLVDNQMASVQFVKRF